MKENRHTISGRPDLSSKTVNNCKIGADAVAHITTTTTSQYQNKFW